MEKSTYIGRPQRRFLILGRNDHTVQGENIMTSNTMMRGTSSRGRFIFFTHSSTTSSSRFVFNIVVNMFFTRSSSGQLWTMQCGMQAWR